MQHAYVLPFAVCGGARGSYTQGGGAWVIGSAPRREVPDAREVQRASLIGWNSFYARCFERHEQLSHLSVVGYRPHVRYLHRCTKLRMCA